MSDRIAGIRSHLAKAKDKRREAKKVLREKEIAYQKAYRELTKAEANLADIEEEILELGNELMYTEHGED
jgi:chromosome segregation ATPase